MVKRSESIKAYVAAMFAIQQVLGKAKKSSDNPYFKSRYADLKTVNDCIDDAMVTAEKNMLIQQYPTTVFFEGKNMVSVTTRLTEPISGEFEEIEVSSPLVDEKAQSFGSTVTYLRRYSLVSIFNISTEEDDGNAGSGNTGKSAQTSGKALPGASNSRPGTIPLTTGTGVPASVPSARAVNQTLAAQSVPQTNAERAVSGKIVSAQYDELKALLSLKGIPMKTWKLWLGDIYHFTSLADISVDAYEGIKVTVEKTPEQIINYKPAREAGQD
jgi:hypothetical protein